MSFLFFKLRDLRKYGFINEKTKLNRDSCPQKMQSLCRSPNFGSESIGGVLKS